LYDADVDGSPNDLLLIRLSEPVEFKEFISPVCLPDYLEHDFIGKYCIATGWGLTKGLFIIPLAIIVYSAYIKTCADKPIFVHI
jgi:hypothetical protein